MKRSKITLHQKLYRAERRGTGSHLTSYEVKQLFENLSMVKLAGLPIEGVPVKVSDRQLAMFPEIKDAKP